MGADGSTEDRVRFDVAGSVARITFDRPEARNAMSFEMANAVMHTTGQAFPMAFQAGGPHAQDRGLEAVAMAWSITWPSATTCRCPPLPGFSRASRRTRSSSSCPRRTR